MAAAVMVAVALRAVVRVMALSKQEPGNQESGIKKSRVKKIKRPVNVSLTGLSYNLISYPIFLIPDLLTLKFKSIPY
jgi:hypothetical protein